MNQCSQHENMSFPASDATRWKQFLTQGLTSIDPLFCYHAVTGQDKLTPICPHVRSSLVCGFLWG